MTMNKANRCIRSNILLSITGFSFYPFVKREVCSLNQQVIDFF